MLYSKPINLVPVSGIYILLILFIGLILVSCSTEIILTEEELNNPDKLLTKARDYCSEEDYNAGIKVYKIILKKYQEQKKGYSAAWTHPAAWAQYELGVTYYIKRDYEEAYKAFKKVVDNFPVPPEPRHLALKLMRKIDNDDAHKRSSY